MLTTLKDTASQFVEDKCPQMAAALAYYALFSMPPLLVIAITLAGFVANLTSFADNGQVRQAVNREAERSLGPGAADQLDAMIEHASSAPKSVWGLVVGGLVFLFGASGVMVQLQTSLNTVWGVIPDPQHGGVRSFLLKRFLSFAMVLGVGFVLLVSMTISAAVTAVGDQLEAMLGTDSTAYIPIAASVAADFVVATLLFAAIFKWLPDARISWRNVWIGSAVTALLFIAGKSALHLYFSRVDIGSTYGAAGSLALILVWVYYSGMIFLLGAEFTRAVSVDLHGTVTPQRGAVAVETTVKRPKRE